MMCSQLQRMMSSQILCKRCGLVHLKKTGEGALAELKNLESCRCVINDLKKNDERMSLKDAKLGHAKRIDSLMAGIYRGA